MAKRYDSRAAKMKIMEACVPLFLEKGYYDTTIKDILTAANVAHSSFFNIFPTKDALLLEYVKYMFQNQFDMANQFLGNKAFPALIYAIETSIQLAVTEMKETLRSIYVEAYSAEGSLNYIIHHTAIEVQKLFGQYFPEANSESDFYERVIGSSGMMRGYMVDSLRFLFYTGKENSAVFRDVAHFLSCSTGRTEKSNQYGLADGLEKDCTGCHSIAYYKIEIPFYS